MPAAAHADYRDIGSRDALRTAVSRSVVARMIDAQLPRGITVLEAGCGTGRLTNFLGMSPWRRVIGADPDEASLATAEDFRRRFGINNAAFVRMSLSRMPFAEGSLDVVVSSGMLHRAADPREGFRRLAAMLRPGGLIIVTLPSAYARAPQPRRATHSQGEVLGWFDEDGIEFLSGVPNLDGNAVDDGDALFRPHSRGDPLRRALSQITLRFESGPDAGSFAMIGRRSV